MVKRTRRKDFSEESSSSEFEPIPSSNKRSRRRRPLAARKAPSASQTVVSETYDTPHSLSQHSISSPGLMRPPLLEWYSRVHATRGMPWRKPFDPSLDADARAQRAYEVWISEIMLQQTQVATVIPYYNRWMESFPTIKDLAASDIDTVNSMWKGLGYYSRAARLLAAAKKVVEELDGRLPDNAKDMETLIPGVGRYTAGAICSIAFNEQVPVLDGNVSRLISRFLAIHAPPKSKASLDLLWKGAQAIVEGATCAGDVNQALIELGSTVCKPLKPDCGSCPLRPWCRARQISEKEEVENGDIEDLCNVCDPIPVSEGLDAPSVTTYPMKVERKKQREELNVVSVVEWRNDDDRWFLLCRRPEGGLLAGLHEFPTSPEVPTSISPSEESETAMTLLSSLIKSPLDPCSGAEDTAGSTTVRLVKIERAGDVLHVFSHIRKTYRVQWVVLEGGGTCPPELAQRSTSAVARKQGSKKSKVSDSSPEIESMWVHFDGVEEANIGTGVQKVWSLVCSLWLPKGNK
ncbi:DNA glycosylase [Lactarius akahatsu]|uniref:Adenine DNA glycosylase n=1 Tax=Lactarius akahatsu TaxID=416441 RepID=A0AAD4LPR8_9AGAM|nr:DNA glycosylase [Lactarius akahatsu]